MFIQTGITVFSAIFQLFLISFAAGMLVRKNLISKSQIQVLSNVTINIFLPCLIIAKTLIRFHPEELKNWCLQLFSQFYFLVSFISQCPYFAV